MLPDIAKIANSQQCLYNIALLSSGLWIKLMISSNCDD